MHFSETGFCFSGRYFDVVVSPSMQCFVVHMHPCTNRHKYEHLHINDTLGLSIIQAHTHSYTRAADGLWLARLFCFVTSKHCEVFSCRCDRTLPASVSIFMSQPKLLICLLVCLHCFSVMLMWKRLLVQKNEICFRLQIFFSMLKLTVCSVVDLQSRKRLNTTFHEQWEKMFLVLHVSRLLYSPPWVSLWMSKLEKQPRKTLVCKTEEWTQMVSAIFAFLAHVYKVNHDSMSCSFRVFFFKSIFLLRRIFNFILLQRTFVCCENNSVPWQKKPSFMSVNMIVFLGEKNVKLFMQIRTTAKCLY